MPERLPDCHVLDMSFGPALLSKAIRQPVTFLRTQPSHLVRPVRQHEQRHNAKQDGGNSFEQKKPSPPGEPQPVNPQNCACDWSSEDKADRNGRHKPRDRLGPVLIDEPVGKINDHAGKKAGFGRAKQETRAVKLKWSMDKTCKRC